MWSSGLRLGLEIEIWKSSGRGEQKESQWNWSVVRKQESDTDDVEKVCRSRSCSTCSLQEVCKSQFLLAQESWLLNCRKSGNWLISQLVAWSRPGWEYLHHWNQQMLQLRAFFSPGEPVVKYLPLQLIGNSKKYRFFSKCYIKPLKYFKQLSKKIRFIFFLITWQVCREWTVDGRKARSPKPAMS